MTEIDRHAREYNEYFDILMTGFLQFLHLNRTKNSEDTEQLTAQERKVIQLLAREGACTMNDTAKHMMLAVSTMTGIIEKLVRKGLVRRSRGEEDRRVRQVSLTRNGIEIYQQDLGEHLHYYKLILECLREEERGVFLKLLHKMAYNLKISHPEKE